MQLQIRTVLNKLHPLKSFVFADIRLTPDRSAASVHIEARVVPRKNSRGLCRKCGRPGPTYDHECERRFDFVPLWALMVFLV
jgi:transposase